MTDKTEAPGNSSKQDIERSTGDEQILSPIEDIIEDARNGKMFILIDDEDRENEGDIVVAADKISPAEINFMATHARGLICLTLTGERCQQLKLPLMVSSNQTPFGTEDNYHFFVLFF